MAGHLAEGEAKGEHVGGILHRGPTGLGLLGTSGDHSDCDHHDINWCCKTVSAMATGASLGVPRGRNSEALNPQMEAVHLDWDKVK